MGKSLAGFFPDVLRHDEFVRTGMLSGRESTRAMRLHWSVIDPHRHVMSVWRKTSPSLTGSATNLGASVFTNGPFSDYRHPGLRRTLAHFGADAGRLGLRTIAHPGQWDRFHDQLVASEVRHFQAVAPLGFVLGARGGICETRVSRPRVHWFGRRSGHDFDSYQIGPGDPAGIEEGVGGLFRAVRDYTPYSVNQYIRVGYWALAPLTEDPELRRHGVAAALDQYADRSSGGAVARTPPAGLVLVVAGWANTQRLTHLLSAVRVRDAAQFDGGDSLLLGYGNSITVGRLMPPWKQVLQCWGIQFQPMEKPSARAR
jgi:hypothetical protein